MSRHLIIGADTTVNDTDGVVDEGAVMVQKRSADGPTELDATDTLADAPEIRFVQGGPDGNIVSPWIYGKDLIAVGGQSYAAQTAQVSTLTIVGTTTEAGRVFVKVIDMSNGVEPFAFKNYDVAIASGADQTAIALAINTAINLDLPSWIATCVYSLGVITMTGKTVSTTRSEGAIFTIAVDQASTADDEDIAGITSITPAKTNSYSPGVGGGNFIAKMEEEQMGVGYGYYNRIGQPITPTATAVKATTYDVYHFVATKDGSSHSQIHGVDNRIEIYVAQTAGGTNSVEAVLAAWLPDAGFTVPTL
tara:strand:+ start:11447 stop:12364 length:918 start_codon:yes stop_codon:yes gene_type:complete